MKMNKKRWLAFALALLLVSSLVACGQSSPSSSAQSSEPNSAASNATDSAQTTDALYKIKPGGKVGVSLTSREFQRWVMDGDNLKKTLEEKGFTVDLQYANKEPQKQIDQIENMITTGCEAIIIAAVDAGALSGVLERAREEKVFILNYDILILNSPNIDFYIGYDNVEVGRMQGRFIEEKLSLKDGKGPFNIEVFAGGLDEQNAYYIYDGAMEILKPYFDNGQLVVPSGQVDIQTVTIQNWNSEKALARMDNLITSYYADGKSLDAVLTPSDAIGVPVCTSLTNAGFGQGDKPFPVVTANDSTTGAIQSIISGQLSMSVFKDTRILSEKAVGIIDDLANGKMPVPNNTELFDNGSIVIPALVVDCEVVDINNYQRLMIDSGYYTKEELKIK